MKVQIKEDGFEAALNAAVGENKIGWNTNDHAGLLNLILLAMTDEDGKTFELTQEQKDLVHAAIAPTQTLQRSMLHRAFRQAGVEVAQKSMEIMESLIGVPQFCDFLATNKNPETGRPFIGKVAKSARKDTLAALLAKPKAKAAAATAAAAV